MNKRLNGILMMASLCFIAPAAAQDYDIGWWSIDGGGEISSEGGNWQLSGTIGQWDSSESQDLSGGQWTLTGGFWVISEDEGDLLFSDGFES